MLFDAINSTVAVYLLTLFAYWPIVHSAQAIAYILDASLSKATEGDIEDWAWEKVDRFRLVYRYLLGIKVDDFEEVSDKQEAVLFLVLCWGAVGWLMMPFVVISLVCASHSDYMQSYNYDGLELMGEIGTTSLTYAVVVNLWTSFLDTVSLFTPFVVMVFLWKVSFLCFGKVYLINKKLNRHINNRNIHR